MHYSAAHPTVLTASKSLFGHPEPPSGMVALINCVIVLQRPAAPPNIHLRRLNTHIELDAFPALYPTEGMMCQSRTAGVSSFGIGGTIGHATLVGEGKTPKAQPQVSELLAPPSTFDSLAWQQS